MIRINNLSKNFGHKQVLKNITLTFDKGLVYGIVGANGAGKTTLFRCIAGLEEYEGEIIYDGDKLKDHLGFLMTEPFFFDKITGKEYVQLLCNARRISIGNIEERNVFNLPLNEYASTYSTGMKKKLALTAILLQENDCFILDEPFNGVDMQSNLIITEMIHQLKRLEKTVIISSHIFSTLRDTCDMICQLQEGKLVRTVMPEDFGVLEEEMKKYVIGDRVLKFGIK